MSRGGIRNGQTGFQKSCKHHFFQDIQISFHLVTGNGLKSTQLSTGSRVALKGVALLSGIPKLRSAEGVPLIF